MSTYLPILTAVPPHPSTITPFDMKLLSLATSALLATHVSARSTFFSISDAAPLDANLAIPGENPLEHCADPKDDILALKKVDLNPNPPRA